jgi:glycosyltransferase involved in cell wall biosynthesis
VRIAVWHNLPSGGGKRALYDQVAGLLQLGHEVESWCPPSADQQFLPLSNLIKEHVVKRQRVHPSRRQALSELARDTEAYVEAMDRHCELCATEIRRDRFDVLLGNACMDLRVTAIGRYVELASVLYLQEPYRWLYEALPDPPFVAEQRPTGWWYSASEVGKAMRRGAVMRGKEVRVREEVKNARGFGSIACNSLYSREAILRAYGLDSTVGYLGVDEARFSPREPAGERLSFFLSVGAMTPEKNAAFILRGLGHRKDKTWPLVWVANVVNERYASEVIKLAAEVGVTFDLRVGVSDEEIVELYRTAGLFLYAPRLEPFGLAPLEASACGLATVAVAEAGARESIAEGINGFLVSASEVGFAEKVDEVLEQPEKVREMARLGRERVEEQWTAKSASKRLESVLEDAVSKGPAQRTDGPWREV